MSERLARQALQAVKALRVQRALLEMTGRLALQELRAFKGMLVLLAQLA